MANEFSDSRPSCLNSRPKRTQEHAAYTCQGLPVASASAVRRTHTRTRCPTVGIYVLDSGSERVLDAKVQVSTTVSREDAQSVTRSIPWSTSCCVSAAKIGKMRDEQTRDERDTEVQSFVGQDILLLFRFNHIHHDIDYCCASWEHGIAFLTLKEA